MARRMMGPFVALVICLAVVGSALAAAPPPKSISRSRAISQALAFTGFPRKAVSTATQCTVTDPSAQVFPIEKRSVWEVTFEKVDLSFPDVKGDVRKNPTLHTVSVWVDASDGSLIKLFTPPPKEGGIKKMVGPGHREFLAGNNYQFKLTAAPPPRPFVRALTAQGARRLGGGVEAKEVVAYYGLLTHLRGPEPYTDRPAWVIFLGGVKEHFVSGGPPPRPGQAPRPEALGTEVMAMVDATTDKSLGSFMTGGPAETPPAEAAPAEEKKP